MIKYFNTSFKTLDSFIKTKIFLWRNIIWNFLKLILQKFNIHFINIIWIRIWFLFINIRLSFITFIMLEFLLHKLFISIYRFVILYCYIDKFWYHDIFLLAKFFFINFDIVIFLFNISLFFSCYNLVFRFQLIFIIFDSTFLEYLYY